MKNKKEHVKIAVVFLAIALFVLFKLSNFDFRFGDGNAYVYMAQEILNGKLPYRDFFLADPPVFVFILTIFKFIFGKTLLLFQALPIIAESIIAFLIYLLLKKLSNPYSFLAPALYLFSFSILATSNFFTGVQFVVLFIVSAILLYEYGKHTASGIFWALACLVKLYAFPAFAGFFAYTFLKEVFSKNTNAGASSPIGLLRRILNANTKKILIGFLITIFIVILPFILLSYKNFFDYTFFHHLRRPMGISKLETLSLYASKEWMILILGFIGFFFVKRKAIIVSFAFSLIFLLVFKDLYYLYLNILLPFLIISIFYLIEKISDFKNGKNKLAVLTFFALYLAFSAQSILIYSKEYKNQGRFPNVKEIAEYIKTLPEGMELYGGHEIAPLIAILSDRKLFGNIIDTNTQVFSAKTISIKDISEKATEKGIYLLAKTQDYPEYEIYDFGFEGFFDKDVFKNYCVEEKSFPVFYDMSSENTSMKKIGIYLCKKHI